MIEELVPGDRVLSRHEDDVEGAIFEQEVVEIFRRSSWLLRLTIDDRTIDTTPEHPFFVRDRGWTSAGELKAGDQLASLDGDWLSLQHSQILDQDATVYNVSINEFHTYFVGEDQWGWCVWSHNNNPICNVDGVGSAPRGAGEAIDGAHHLDGLIDEEEKGSGLFWRFSGVCSTWEMPCPPRADEASGIYHALNRGNLRATIFHKEGDGNGSRKIGQSGSPIESRLTSRSSGGATSWPGH